MNNSILTFCLLAALTLFSATTAAQERSDGASPPADEMLQHADVQNNPFRDATLQFTMRIKEPTSAREVGFILLQKGTQKRLVRFISPNDIKGMAFLVESADIMHALLPAFGNRVRRLGTHVRAQSFMGSDMTYEDFSVTELAPFYNAKLVGLEDGSTILELNQKAGVQHVFPRLKLRLNQRNNTVSKIEYYDVNGSKLRTQIRSDFKQDSATQYLLPQRIVFIDHSRNNHETELILTKSQFNTGLSDELFTTGALRGN